MTEFSKGRDEEVMIKRVMDYLDHLDQDSKAEAILDMEEAAAGSPIIDRPLWLRDVSREVIEQARFQLMNAVHTKTSDESLN